ncbi:MAG: hypothetical protein F9K43_14760 [Bauldia sp.]|nr:MAG: hypothetical protein F9K43_14760 [Bauldia sp.]MBZ0228150.1 hypothetical protein [Bauldia sp.]
MAVNPDKELADSLERIRADIAALSGTVSQLVSDTAGIQASLRKKVNNAAKQASAAGEELMNEAVEMGGEALHAAAKSASGAVDSIEGQIVRNPMTSVLVALGLGFAIGLVSRK